jgi:hypothetical protein
MGQLRSAVDALVAVDAAELDDGALGELMVELSRQRDRLEAVYHRLVAEHDRRRAWRGDGARSEQAWLRQRCRLSAGEAASRTEIARRLTALPATTAALAEGRITAGHARVAAAALRDLPREAAVGLDRLVAERAGEVDPGRLRAEVDDFAHRVAAHSLADREQRAWEGRRLRLSRTVDGVVVIDGRLDPVGGETMLTALGALAAPGDATDARSPEQRRADALVTLCRRSLDAGDLPDASGQRPHVTVVTSLETLQGQAGAPPAQLDRLGALSAPAARRLACDAAVTRVLTAGASQPLDVGRATRVVSPAQRRALAVRDGGCVGCHAPVTWCEAHHIRHWAGGGPTDLDNLILVCWGCHRNLHERGWEAIRGPDGRWTLLSPQPDGRPPPRPG